MHVFERGMHHSSVRIAKERLKSPSCFGPSAVSARYL